MDCSTGKDDCRLTFGVDVSHWEGRIDWQAAAGAIGFAYYKCTDGTRGVDDEFEHNRGGCTAAGLPHAPYHYFQPLLDPIAQAEHFIQTAGMSYRRYIVDVEARQRDSRLTTRLHQFLQHAEQLTGIQPAIYTSPGYWNDYLQPQPAWAHRYDLLVAHYTFGRKPILPQGWERFTIWQFNTHWYFPGCGQEADANWFNGDPAACRLWFGNAATPQPALPPLQPLLARSLFDELHIRQDPSLQAKVTGSLTRGELVEVEQLGGDDLWVRHARGWSALEVAGYRTMELVNLQREAAHE